MLPCKHIAKTLAVQNVRDLVGWHGFYVKFHASLCPLCGPFHRDVIKMQGNARAFADQTDLGEAKLSDESKSRMRKRLRDRTETP